MVSTAMPRPRPAFGGLKAAAALTVLLTCLGAVPVAEAVVGATRDLRHFDTRGRFNLGFRAEPGEVQRSAVRSLRAARPGLAVTWDQATGAARTLQVPGGYLTGPDGRPPRTVALDFLRHQLLLLGLTPADLVGYEVTDEVFSAVTGATHLYLRQTHGGLPVYNGQLQVNVNRDGRILSVNNAFLPDLAAAVPSAVPTLGAGDAVERAARQVGLTASAPRVVETRGGLQRPTRIEHAVSAEPIEAKLMWLPVRAGEARLVWNFQIHTRDAQHIWDFTVDAHDGRVWTRIDWVAAAEYRVIPQPFESPQHSPIVPPADGRTLEIDPQDATASPSGWHDDGTTAFTTPQGNNVHAYEDSNASNSPPAVEPDCGAPLSCDFGFPIDFGTQEPSTYIAAAVTNLFYWNNIIHDVQYQYGFDEAAGNFQVDNFGNGGAGGDPVRAEAQDGSGNCNANFSTPPDGSPVRMQMFLCNNVTPSRDGDLDSGVIVHEYGHGISIRQVGGPDNSGCLGNNQQPGEGLSDWWAMAYTAEVGDTGADVRGMGTYLFGQPPDGPGIRPQPYSTDPAVNDYTYESINGLSVPHGVGSVWAQVAWEAYWALVDQHGFSADIYDALGPAGNNRMMLYVNEGLKNTACGPAFTDVRDGILQAAADNHGGEDVCLLWEAFGAFGLGTDAVSGGPGSTSPTNGFEIPVECLCEPGQTIPIADTGGDELMCAGGSVTLGTPALPGHTYLWSPGGETTAQITVSPAETTTYTVTVTTDCGSKSDSATVFVDPGTGGGLVENFESGAPGWTFDGLWHVATDSACPAPEPGYSSPVNAAYFGQDAGCTYGIGGAAAGLLVSPPIFGIDASSTLSFDFLREVESFGGGSFDVTEVQVLAGGTTTSVFLLDSTDPSDPVWGSSGAISLAAFAGQVIQLRFRFDTVDGVSNSFLGWFVDDIEVTGTSECVGGGVIFSDGFEAGDTSAWSSTAPLP